MFSVCLSSVEGICFFSWIAVKRTQTHACVVWSWSYWFVKSGACLFISSIRPLCVFTPGSFVAVGEAYTHRARWSHPPETEILWWADIISHFTKAIMANISVVADDFTAVKTWTVDNISEKKTERVSSCFWGRVSVCVCMLKFLICMYK